VKILGVKPDDLIESMRLSKKCSLLASDALSVAVMNRNNIGIIATNDSDFKRVKGIEMWVPDVG